MKRMQIVRPDERSPVGTWWASHPNDMVADNDLPRADDVERSARASSGRQPDSWWRHDAQKASDQVTPSHVDW